jgi:predicted nucleotidyltransferase
VKEARDRLDELVRDLRRVLGDNLVGVYLHGSLALGCFNAALSDLDLLVVEERPLTAEERQALAPLLARAGRIEISFLVEASLTPWRHPAHYDLHFSSPARLIGPGEDHDLAAHFTVTRHGGIALVGPSPSDVFPQVPWEDYEDSLRRDLAWSRDHATELYGVLSPARIWATLRTKEIHSKESGAAWALERSPADFQPLLERALAMYRTGDQPHAFERAQVLRFADFVKDQLRPSRSRASGGA